MPVGRLCAALWPDADGDAARNSFDNALHRLRKLLGDDRHAQLHAGGLSLDPTTCWTDMAALETCLEQVDDLARDPDPMQASALLHRALALYRGDFLVGEEELAHVLVARERIKTRFTRQMGELGAAFVAAGRCEEATHIYQRVIELHLLAEEISRKLIVCLLVQRQPAEAYEVYRRCRHQLSVVLGIRPGAQTEALVAELHNL